MVTSKEAEEWKTSYRKVSIIEGQADGNRRGGRQPTQYLWFDNIRKWTNTRVSEMVNLVYNPMTFNSVIKALKVNNT